MSDGSFSLTGSGGFVTHDQQSWICQNEMLVDEIAGAKSQRSLLLLVLDSLK